MSVVFSAESGPELDLYFSYKNLTRETLTSYNGYKEHLALLSSTVARKQIRREHTGSKQEYRNNMDIDYDDVLRDIGELGIDSYLQIKHCLLGNRC